MTKSKAAAVVQEYRNVALNEDEICIITEAFISCFDAPGMLALIEKYPELRSEENQHRFASQVERLSVKLGLPFKKTLLTVDDSTMEEFT